ncbi:hypothetical protein P7C70_g7248, partial [Phenoliferia sp. Uapishka_3]
MPPKKVPLGHIIVGRSSNPTDPVYYFCNCTPCYNGRLVTGMNQRGKWLTLERWNFHRRDATRHGRDLDRFSSNPLLGYIPRVPHVVVKEDSDLEGSGEGEGRGEPGGSDSEMADLGVESGSGPNRQEEDDNMGMGGMDDFQFDNEDFGSPRGSPTPANLLDASHEARVVVKEESDDEEEEESDDEDDYLVFYDALPEQGVAGVRYKAEELAPGDFDCRDGDADDEEAQFEHHRVYSDDEPDDEEPDAQVDADEELAELLGRARLANVDQLRDREKTPNAEEPDFNDYGGGGADFDDDDDEDGQGFDPNMDFGGGAEDLDDLDEEDRQREREEAEAERAEAEAEAEAMAGAALGLDGEDDDVEGMDRADEPEGERAPSPFDAAAAGAERPTAEKAHRLPQRPFVRCAPPSRTLDRDDTVRLHLFELAIDFAMGPKLIERLRWFLWTIGVEVEGIDSLYMLRQHAHRISNPMIRWYDHCPGHTTSSNPATADWVFCEVPVKVREGKGDDCWEPCGSPRYFATNTPNLKTLRKNSQKLGQVLPPLDKVPVHQHSHMSIHPFVDALYANPIHSRDILRANRESIVAAATDADRITSFETAEIPRELFHPVAGLCHEDDLLLSTTSDGADIYPDACPDQPVKAHVAAVRAPCLCEKSHDLCYVCGVNGPKKGYTTLYLHPVTEDLEDLEEPRMRYSSAKGGMVDSRVFAPLNCSDTVEQCDLSATVGAAGRCPSMLHKTQGVFNRLISKWQHPLRDFARIVGLGNYARRGDIETVLDDEPRGPGEEKLFTPEVRDLPDYERVNAELTNARTKAEKKRVQKDSGIKGRSIFAVLSIFAWVYPWIFALDDMHVTYSNNMKHFLISMFGKSGKKPTNRGKMVSSANHYMMAKELRRTIHLQPAAHGQKVRGIEHLNRLKAAETRSFVWFHLAPLFHGVYEHAQDMALVVAAIRSTRLTNHRVMLRGAIFDGEHRTFDFNEDGEFVVPLANVRRAQDDFLIKREKLFVNRDPEYGATCVPSLYRAQALPDMCRLWGPGLLATTQWALEGKIGDLKRFAKSRALPVKNMENNNINRNMMVLIRLLFDFPKYDPQPNEDLRHQHPTLDSTIFLHKKEANPTITPQETEALLAYLGEIGEQLHPDQTPTRWQRLQISTGEIIGSISRERGTELERIIIEDDADQDDTEAERVGLRRATRFAKYTLRPAANEPDGPAHRSHELFEVDSYMCIPLSGENRPLFVALGRTFPPLQDCYGIHEAFEIGNAGREFIAIGAEQIRHGVGLTLGIKREEEEDPMWWVTMNVAKATAYRASQF